MHGAIVDEQTLSITCSYKIVHMTTNKSKTKSMEGKSQTIMLVQGTFKATNSSFTTVSQRKELSC